jgi:ATPase subunit of ABC transporter with duplicated ATPase domains
MADISAHNLVKAFEEGNNIIDGLSLEILEGERVGLLGKNGAGKTTLFRLIAGEIESDEGEVTVAPGKKLGLISQIPVYPEEFTTEDVLRAAHTRLFEIKARMDALAERMSRGESGDILGEYDRLANDFDRLGGYSMETDRNRVANGLEIPQQQRGQLFNTLSGGEKTRANLARLILEDTDILLLDEPTNHLDMRAVEWLEDYLRKFKGTVLAISHDRYFLDRAVTRVVEISNGKAELYSGNYSFFVAEKRRRELEQLKKYEREQAEAKRLQTSADRLHAWGTGNKNLVKKAFAIESRIERLVKTERPKSEKQLRARFGEIEFRGDEALILRDVKKSFDGKLLFDGLNAEVLGGERIAIIGDNGTGKSTLLTLIMDEDRPDAGIIKRGNAVKTAYLPQIIKFNNPYRSVLDTLIYDGGYAPQIARNRLGAFKFSGEDVFKQVCELSGGEQSRLRLCTLMNEEINFLILDEPTNHLDIASREWIEEAVSDYDGTLLFVSHDRYFIDRFATRVWELGSGAFTDFKGTFAEYTAYKAARVETKQRAAKTEDKPKRPKRDTPRNTQKQIERAESEIAALEERLKELENQKEQYASDYEKLLELMTDEETLNRELEEKYDMYFELTGES